MSGDGTWSALFSKKDTIVVLYHFDKIFLFLQMTLVLVQLWWKNENGICPTLAEIWSYKSDHAVKLNIQWQ